MQHSIPLPGNRSLNNMPGDKLSLSFSDISEALHKYSFPEADYVMGIATGGIYPAVMIAHQLKVDFGFIHINFRDPSNTPRFEEPQLLSRRLPDLDRSLKILLVDEVSVSGKTLQKAKEILCDYEVSTFVLKGKADHVLFPGIKTCVLWPWKPDQ